MPVTRCKFCRPVPSPNGIELLIAVNKNSGLHGYTHEAVSRLTIEQERAVMAKSIEVYKEFTGRHPRGWVAPSWEVSPNSMQILEDFGIEYDHSMLHHDCQPYWAPNIGDSVIYTDYSKDPSAWMAPMVQQKVTTVVEIPGSWNVDDWRMWPTVSAMPL